jgi:hypothetical protein
MVSFSKSFGRFRRSPTSSDYRGSSTTPVPQNQQSRKIPGICIADDIVGKFVMAHVLGMMKLRVPRAHTLQVSSCYLSWKIQTLIRQSEQYGELRSARQNDILHTAGRLSARWGNLAVSNPPPSCCTECNAARPTRSGFYIPGTENKFVYECSACGKDPLCHECVPIGDSVMCERCRRILCTECLERTAEDQQWGYTDDGKTFCCRCTDELEQEEEPEEDSKKLDSDEVENLIYVVRPTDCIPADECCPICHDIFPTSGSVIAAFGCGKTERNKIGHWICESCALSLFTEHGHTNCVTCRSPVNRLEGEAPPMIVWNTPQ